MFWQVTLFLLPLRFLQKAKYFLSLSFHRITQMWEWLSGMLSFKYIVLFYIYKNQKVPGIVSQLQTPLVFGCYQNYFLNKLNTKTEARYVKTIHGFFRSLNLKEPSPEQFQTRGNMEESLRKPKSVTQQGMVKGLHHQQACQAFQFYWQNVTWITR